MKTATGLKIINHPQPSLTAQLLANLRTTLPNANIEITRLPGCDNIQLALIDHGFDTGPLDPDVMQAVIRHPAYWAFCWGSGLGLAHYLAANPHWVQGKSVIDLGSGCGIGAIAAFRAGANKVIAVDSDEQALVATRTNAALNDVEITTATQLDGLTADLTLMADVLYDKGNYPLLKQAQKITSQVLVADSRIHNLDDFEFRQIAKIEALTYPNLGEFDEFRQVSIFIN